MMATKIGVELAVPVRSEAEVFLEEMVAKVKVQEYEEQTIKMARLFQW